MSKHETIGVYDYDRNKLCDLYDSQNDLIGQAYEIRVSKDWNGNNTLEFCIPYMLNVKSDINNDGSAALFGSGIYGRSRFGIGTTHVSNRNFRWDFLKSDYMIRYTCGDKNIWFVASKPKKCKSGKKIYGSVVCNGLESLLKTRNIYMVFDDENGIGTIQYMMTQILKGTGWTFDSASSDTMYERDGTTEKVRSLKSDGKKGAMDLINTVCNLFQAIPVFDTDAMKVSVKAINNRQQVLEGVVGKNLSAIDVTYDASNVATRVYVEGEYGDYGYVGIDDVEVDGSPYGLPFLVNFDYYRSIGVFKAVHETALSTYMSAIKAKKAAIRANSALMISVEDQINTMIGQCKLVVYYKSTGYVTPRYVYGDMTDEQKTLSEGDNVVIIKDNGKFSYEEWENSPASQMTGAYAVAKFVTPSSGRIGAAEVQIESKQKTIEQLQHKIEITVKQDKIAEYQEEIARLNREIEAIYVGAEVYDEMAAYAVNDTCSHVYERFVCTTAIAEHDQAHEWNAFEWQLTTLDGLYKMMQDVMKSDGLLYQFEHYEDVNTQLNTEQDQIEATFIVAMGYMLRDGYWNNNNYTIGQEEFLYADAVDVTAEMSKPATSYSFSFIRVTDDFDIPAEDIEINAIFKLYDPEVGIDDKLFVKKITYGVDDKSLGSIEVSNQDITLTGNDLGSLLSRMSQLADLIEQKNALYERAKALTNSGSIYADRLEGQIDVMRTKILSSVSNWYTDDRGNMVFIAADGASAVMMSGAGIMLADSKNDDGSWAWRTAIDGHGMTADEIVAGFISAERIESGSITTNHLSSEVGTSLNLSSNTSINLMIGDVYDDMDELLGYRLEIISTTDILSTDITSTTLTAKVWHGSEDVTSELAAERFNWKRTTSDSTADATWNSNHEGMKSITVTCADVDYSATYSCELLAEEEGD